MKPSSASLGLLVLVQKATLSMLHTTQLSGQRHLHADTLHSAMIAVSTATHVAATVSHRPADVQRRDNACLVKVKNIEATALIAILTGPAHRIRCFTVYI